MYVFMHACVCACVCVCNTYIVGPPLSSWYLIYCYRQLS